MHRKIAVGRATNLWPDPIALTIAAAVPQPDDPAVTRLLEEMRQGSPGADARLLSRLYGDLYAQARRFMAEERPEHTLQPTALLHEAFLRLVDPRAQSWESRGHFMRVAARAMRNVLIDHARARRADKRGGAWRRVTLVDDVTPGGHEADDLLALDENLSRLSERDPQLGEVVELRFFGGMKDAEIAAALEVSPRTVQRSWRMARAWLVREMQRTTDDG